MDALKRLWGKDEPVVGSLLETDVYKILMLYFIWRYFPNLRVKFGFTNRTRTVRLAESLDIGLLRENIEHVKTLRFSDADIAYIRSWQMVPEEFLLALRDLRLSKISVDTTHDGQLRIETEGPWFDNTLWELYILPMITELRARQAIGESDAAHRAVIQDGEERLLAKVPTLKGLHWKIALFDLRRRLTGRWERHTSRILYEEIPERLSGISNVALARELGVEATGTNAHELPMALVALRSHEGPEAMREALYEVLEKWQSLFGHKALIMLPDTFGSEYFFRNLPGRYLRDFRGSRQDSGDPLAYGEARIRDYREAGIDPLQKLVLFSDGLTPEKMQELEMHLYGRIGGGFGWGTNKSHDVAVLPPMSIVMKLTEAAGNPAVKLSDNIDKATGFEPGVVEAKRIFGYHSEFHEAPIY
jgi:nicotinate phosphoribosyltransferase